MHSVVPLADHLHFGRAAMALHISQPVLTKQARKAEATLGEISLHDAHGN
jgi:DNA-binding transcriptional LysR family regulator